MRTRCLSLSLPWLLLFPLLVLGGIGAPTALAQGVAPDLQTYLGTYYQPAQPPVVDSEAEPIPPESLLKDRTVPVVRTMPPTYPVTNQDDPSAPCTWPNHPMIVWGRVDGGNAPYQFQMDFGDGTPPVTGNVDGSVGRKTYYIAVAHTYTTAGLKTARLTVTDNTSQVAYRDVSIQVEPVTGNERIHDLLVKRNAAIQDGLRWMYLQQQSNGCWSPSWNPRAVTAAVLSAFEVYRHLPTNDPQTDIYAEFVQKGLEYIYSNLVSQSIGVQQWGNPDSNGDGLGIRHNDGGTGAYEQGLIMYAIALSRAPNLLVPMNGVPNVQGKTYREILQNMVDQLAWAQTDGSGGAEGGWRYYVDRASYDSDNSAVQWASIGLDAAEVQENGFMIPVPAFVKSELGKWLSYSRCGDGGYGYTSATWCNMAKTGSGIFSQHFRGLAISDPLIQTGLTFISNHWCDSYDSNTYYEQFHGNFYALYAVKKPLDDWQDWTLPGGQDWRLDQMHFLLKDYTTPCQSNSYHQVANYATPNLETDGYWPLDSVFLTSTVPSSAWALLTLIPGIHCDLYAVGTATPQNACPGSPIQFDGSQSQTTCQDHEVVQWLWDFDDRDGASIHNPDAMGTTVVNQAGYQLPQGQPTLTVHATLWAIDREINGQVPPDTAMTTIPVVIDINNHPPEACLNGPFTACVGDPIYLDGCCSFDPDGQGMGCQADSVVLYEWDLGGDGSIDFTTPTCRPANPLVFNQETTMSVVLWVRDTHGTRSTQAAANLIWSSRQDLFVAPSDIALSPAHCSRDTVRICATIHARLQGGAPVIPAAKVGVYYDVIAPLNLICEQTFANVGNGETRQICCTWQLPDTLDHDIVVVCDPDHQLQECVETDNVASLPYAWCNCVTVTAGDPVLEGGWYKIPIQTPDDMSWEPVYAFQMDCAIDPAFFNVTDVSRIGAITEGQGMFGWRRLAPGLIRITWAGVNAIAGPGTFAYLVAELQPNAPCGQTTDLVVQNIMFNEGSPCALAVNGHYTVPTTPMAGHVFYYACDQLDNSPPNPRAMSGVTMTLVRQCASSVDSMQVATDLLGAYVLGGCDECDNYIRPSKARSLGDPEITSWDASLILRYVLTYDPFDKCSIPAAVYDPSGLGGSSVCPPPGGFAAGVIHDAGWPGNPAAYHILPQRVVGDVSRNGTVTAYDAALVLKYIVGDPLGLSSHTGSWDFYCEERNYAPEVSITNANFTGLLSGDVSGSWVPGRGAAVSEGPPITVAERLEWQGNDQWRVTLGVQDVGGFLAGDFRLDMDPQVWSLVQVTTTPLTQNFLVEGHMDGGSLRIALAGAEPVSDGDVVRITLSKQPGTGLPLPLLVWAQINDGSRPVVINLPTAVEEPESAPLIAGDGLRVEPNPFRGVTEFRFRVAQIGPVALELYAPDGRLVRRLLSGSQTPGTYTVVWDGKNAHGATLSSGVYFARLRRPGSSEVQRVVMLQ
jgi:hypothetical protein